MNRRKLMTNEQLKDFYIVVLEIAAHERGNRKKAQEMARFIMAEMIRRGM